MKTKDKILDKDGREITHYCVTPEGDWVHIQWADFDQNFYPIAEAKDHNINITDPTKVYGKFIEV